MPRTPPPPQIDRGAELISNFSFEVGQPVNPGGFTTQATLPGWATVAGSAPLEVIGSPYPNASGIHTIFGTHALDTMASPGGVDIKQVGLDTQGYTLAHIQITLAAENINGLKTDPNDHLLLKFNGDVVKDFTMADFTSLVFTDRSTPPTEVIDYNHMVTFDFYAIANNNPGPGGTLNTLELQGVDNGAPSVVGMAVDAVSLHAFG